jgi:hypothetical protein
LSLGPTPHTPFTRQPSNFCNQAGKTQVCSVGACPEADCELCCRTPEPSNKWDFPPYALGGALLGAKSLPPSVAHFDGTRMYDTHNLYGLLMAR